MERLLMERFIEKEETNTEMQQPQVILNIVKTCSRDTLKVSLQDPSMLNTLQKYREFEDKARKNHLGKRAAFWFSFIEHSRLVFMLLKSVKENNLKLFHKSNGMMANLFLAYDGQNYSG